MFTGFGWLSAGYSQTDSWLMGYAPVLGLHGIGWGVLATAGAIVTIASSLYEARSGRKLDRRSVGAAALVVLAVWGGGALAGSREWTTPKDESLTVALVQGSVPQTLKWQPEQLEATMSLYLGLTRRTLGADLIVWPEAALPTLVDYVGPYLDAVRRAADERGSTVLLGILDADSVESPEISARNVLIALTEPPQMYVKRHLVPFGEYFPVPDFVRSWMRLMNLPFTDIQPAAADQPEIAVGDERIAVTICYEDVFGAEQLQFLPDATLLVNVSNDAWFGDSIAPPQHLQIARVRAAEVGRWLLRSTNTGITAVIDPRGHVAKTVPQFEATVLEHEVRGYTGSTPYVRWGNWLVIAAACVAVLAGGFASRRRG